MPWERWALYRGGSKAGFRRRSGGATTRYCEPSTHVKTTKNTSEIVEKRQYSGTTLDEFLETNDSPAERRNRGNFRADQ
ncbi:Hypothetical protein NTJ_06557 [Nesidiocoris tenuis]|uniref:Uncharacterized protein n=1 Tax=Nesidiocoris tenuis TaxID=355587 RepID=A0ABN7ANE5_9HEMI|nr:Hypothetical protein NTJ_06557 [Nesidiocoris tenuis]